MRKLGKRITQKGSDKRVNKNLFEIVTDLTRSDTKEYSQRKHSDALKKIISKKDVAKKLGISTSSLRNYRRYFIEPNHPKSTKPPDKVIKKLQKLAKAKNIRLTRTKGLFFPRLKTNSFKELISDRSFKNIIAEKNKEGFNGIFIRVHILIITSTGSYLDWISMIPEVALLRSKKKLDDFISGEIKKRMNAKSSIIAFEIIETIIDVTLKEYIENVKTENPKQAKTNKKPRKGKK